MGAALVGMAKVQLRLVVMLRPYRVTISYHNNRNVTVVVTR